MKTTFWDWIIKTFYVQYQDIRNLDAKHSLVMTLDSQVRYLPNAGRK